MPPDVFSPLFFFSHSLIGVCFDIMPYMQHVHLHQITDGLVENIHG